MYRSIKKRFSPWSKLKPASSTLINVGTGFSLLFISGIAHAIPTSFVYDPTNSSASFSNQTGICLSNTNDCNLDVEVNQTVQSITLDNVGDAGFFDFLTITAGGLGTVGFGSADLNATLAYSSPEPAQGSGSASVSGSFFFTQQGTVNWNFQPTDITFSDGSSVSLNFSGGSDSCSIFFNCGAGLSVDVAATTTLQTQPVSLPNTLPLLGIGMLSLVMNRRRSFRS